MRHTEPNMQSGAGRQAIHRLFAAAVLAASTAGAAAQAPPIPFVPNNVVTSTVPANGDFNPYGVAFVPANFPTGGTIAPFDILVSNFDSLNFKNKGKLPGTGTTIIKYTPNTTGGIAPNGKATVFFQSTRSSVTGLDAGLAVLQNGFVLCAFVPSTDGYFDTHMPGGILVLDKSGNLVTTILASPKTGINSPWDMTVFDQGTTALAFVSNVGFANNGGFVSRLDLSVSSGNVKLLSATIIASGYMAQPNPVGFVTGPTGLVYDPTTDILYVASTLDNAVFAVKQAGHRGGSGGPGIMIFNDTKVLFGPLGLAQAANGDLITANSDLPGLPVSPDPAHPSEYVEFTKNGTQPSSFVSQFNIDVVPGAAFGIAVGATADGAPRLAVVDDNVPNLNIFTGLTPSLNRTAR
jgi:hypothetical protein